MVVVIVVIVVMVVIIVVAVIIVIPTVCSVKVVVPHCGPKYEPKHDRDAEFHALVHNQAHNPHPLSSHPASPSTHGLGRGITVYVTHVTGAAGRTM